jgi:hypothetical protein
VVVVVILALAEVAGVLTMIMLQAVLVVMVLLAKLMHMFYPQLLLMLVCLGDKAAEAEALEGLPKITARLVLPVLGGVVHPGFHHL